MEVPMNGNLISILTFVLGLVLGVIAFFAYKTINIKKAEKTADSIIDKAKKDAEKHKRDTILEAKEEVHRIKLESEKEIKEKKNEIKDTEARLLQRENNIDRRDLALQKRESYIKEKEEEAKLEVDTKAKEMLISCMEKYAADVTNEQTVSVITLPNDEMKGRIIGREGRNVRTIESVTGVDLIIDDTPEAIVISSFDPLRREIAKLTLETLIKDGRIHPTRIEEVYSKMSDEVNQKIKEYGKNAIYELGISKMDPKLIETIGRLHFRTSYGQNALKHSMEVANISGIIAGELGERVNLAKRAGLLHDIGKAIDYEMEGSHVQVGMEIAKKYNEDEVVINAIASHHGDCPSTSIISTIVSIADTISASRPGARNDSTDIYFQRLEKLEQIGNDIEGVEKTYAIQAGRELRVIVKPEEVDDLMAHQIALDIKDRIEAEMQYPGTIKVTVVRETRATEEAK